MAALLVAKRKRISLTRILGVAIVAGVMGTGAVLVASGCASTSSAPNSASSVPERPEIPCNTDSECHGGICRMGNCAQRPGTSAAPTRARCTFDSECPRGRCESGTCLTQQSSEHMCNFDSDCPSGACRNGRCGPAQADFRP